MYLTAHRVWSRTLQREGVHAFIYRHSEPLRSPIDIAWIADHEPGKLEASLVELPAGGNEVRSYLDIVAHSDLSVSEFADALGELVDAVRATDATVAYSGGINVACRFYANPAAISSSSSRVDEVLTLGRALRRLYERPCTNLPLVVRAETGDRSIRLSLDPASGQRVRELLGPGWRIPPSISIERDTLEDFEATQGTLFQHLIPVLTGLDTRQIEALGGVRVVTMTGHEIPIPKNPRKTIHVLGDRGFHNAAHDLGNARSGNIYEVLYDDTTKISKMLGAQLIEKEQDGHYDIEWNGFAKKP
jgi:hypothetical protein